jgi:formylglycine-generating enzyme required for sulfatase activity
MKVRQNKNGGFFLGCTYFPTCRGTRNPPPELVERIKEAEGGSPAVEKPVPRTDLPPRLTNTIGMTFVLIPSGSFRMGSPFTEDVRAPDEAPALLTQIERPFYLAVHPVTQKAYEAVMKANPSHFHKKNGGGPDHPVEQTSWDDAVGFCRKLSALAEEKKAGRVYRLPSEKEWEYACRAGTRTAFCFGETLSSEQANFDGGRPYGGAEAGSFRQKTTKVGAFEANAWGLFDVHGNVWEWCDDWHSPEETHRVLRGGSWNNSGHLCRSARRQKYPPEFIGDNVGFRVALEV